ncbi:MAG: preprotein translocase subunit YajC [Pirellulales bacterium]|nr:preprotein translocase subunit YajC [Pirellulales bacterium]
MTHLGALGSTQDQELGNPAPLVIQPPPLSLMALRFMMFPPLGRHRHLAEVVIGARRGPGSISRTGRFCSLGRSTVRAGQLVGNTLTGITKTSFGQILPDGRNVLETSLNYLLIAQDVQPDVPGLSSMLVPLTIIMALFYFMILRPQKNKEQSFRTMVDNLKEKDRIVTIGGIHGVVTNVQRDRDEVTVRVDESTGTKIRIGTSAIARVVTDEDKNEK